MNLERKKGVNISADSRCLLEEVRKSLLLFFVGGSIREEGFLNYLKRRI